MDINFLAEYMSAIIVALCLLVGYLIKHSITVIPNKYIPLIVAVLGVGVSVWMDWGAITPVTIVTGLASGLASTGLYEMFREMIGVKPE